MGPCDLDQYDINPCDVDLCDVDQFNIHFYLSMYVRCDASQHRLGVLDVVLIHITQIQSSWVHGILIQVLVCMP